MFGYARKWMLISQQKLDRNREICRMFHVVAAAVGKARSVSTERRVDCTSSDSVFEERRWRRPSTSAAHRTLTKQLESTFSHAKKGVSITGRNCTGPPCSVGRHIAHTPGRRRPDRPRARRPAGRVPAALQTTDDADRWRRQTTHADRRQRTKQYWSVRRASNKKQQ